MDFAEQFRQARKRSGMTQEQLAEQSGVSASLIAHAETGRRLIGLENLERLVDALDLDEAGREALLAARRAAKGVTDEDIRHASMAGGEDVEWVREHDPATWRFIVETARAARKHKA